MTGWQVNERSLNILKKKNIRKNLSKKLKKKITNNLRKIDQKMFEKIERKSLKKLNERSIKNFNGKVEEQNIFENLTKDILIHLKYLVYMPVWQ